jgi:hypothetical protein
MSALASITITPQPPGSTDTFKIRVANFFGSEAFLSASSITQVGNTFVIHQDVALICSLPSDPTVASEFQVGPLPSGVYNVTATIDFHDAAPTNIPCFRAPMTETTAFTVGSAIPAMDYLHLVSLALALAAIALIVLSTRRLIS